MSALEGLARAAQPATGRQGQSIRFVAGMTRLPYSVTAATAAAAAAGHGGPPPSAYVYSGPGAGTRSVLSTLHSLREALVPSVQVASLDAAELLEGGWRDGCLLLVMPGGADLPYCRHLGGRGNILIREFVEGGGAYLGLCAGAYYACARVEFEPGTGLEVVGDRQLRFFPGTAAGSIYSGFCYESEDGAVAAPLRFLCLDDSSSSPGLLAGACGAQAVQARSGTDGGAIDAGTSSCSSGSDGSCLPSAEWQEVVDYVNGGPGFFPAGNPAADFASGQQQQQQWRQQGTEVLATYSERGGAVAALLCHVGSWGGRAVLCSTHPELHPSWLSGSTPPPWSCSSGQWALGSSSVLVAGGSAGPRAAAFVNSVGNQVAVPTALAVDLSPTGHVLRLQAALLAGQRHRWRFWRSLLMAAGLQPWMQPFH